MSVRALATSPLARLLLSLLERHADGSVEIGGRTLVLAGGEVVEVRGDVSDESLGDLLVRTGRLDAESFAAVRERAAAQGLGLEEALCAEPRPGGVDTSGALRSLRVERFARGIVAEEALGRVPPFVPATAHTAAHAGVPRAALVPLLLDALASAARTHAPDSLAEHEDDRVEPLEAPHLDEALRWAGLDADALRLVDVGRYAATADDGARLAALARAGFVRFVAARASSAPAPPLRPPGLDVPARVDAPSAPPAAPSVLPPARKAVLVLAPGAGPAPEHSEGLATPLRDFPPASAPLGDPVAAVELTLAHLEQQDAPGPERAAAWRLAAQHWQTCYGAIEEAARCLREAAAAHPGDREALEQAALLCATLGSPELSIAYGNAAIALTPAGPSRDEAQLRVALWAERAGQHEVALHALRAAVARHAAGSAGAPDTVGTAAIGALEHLFARLVADGAHDEAVALVRHSAPRIATREPIRARTMVADALALRPDDAALARQLAAALAGEGLPDAAALVLAETARAATDAEKARHLRLEAAEQAEESGRPDIAAEFLLEALDAEPFLDAVHEAVALDLERAGATLDLAIVCEQLARDAEDPETQAGWWLRAANAHAARAGGWEAALDALVRAAELTPDAAGPAQALAALAAGAQSEARVADACERVAHAALARGATTTSDWLRALVRLDAPHADAAPRLRWALARLCERAPDDEDARARLDALEAGRDTERVSTAERALTEATPAARPALARAAGLLLARDPARRAEALARLREAAAALPDDTTLAESLARIAWIDGDDATLARTLAAQAEHAGSARGHALARLAAVQSARGETQACADTCAQRLSTDSDVDEALARLQRAAARLGDARLAERALTGRATRATDARARSRALVALARLHATRGDHAAAARRAEEALALDAQSAAAAAMLVALAHALPTVRAPALLEAARAVLGDSPALLDALRRAARDAGDAAAAGSALDTWVRIAPNSARPALARLAHRVAGGDARAIVGAATNALAPESLHAATEHALLAALERLEALGATTEAVSLGLRALDALGATCATLRAHVLSAAARCGDSTLHVAALERWVGASRRHERLAPLAALAAVHRAAGDAAAESRAHLRTLAVSLYDPHALTRLEAIYAAHGEGERLLAVLGLRLEACADDDARRHLLRDLAAAAAHVAQDPTRAARFVDALLQLAGGDTDAIRQAAGALVTLGQPEAAVERLLARAAEAPPREAAVLCAHAASIAEQEAHDPRLALSATARGLERAPSSAPLLLAFERLAIGLRDVAEGRRTYRALADAAMGPHGRRAVLYRAARFHERCDDPEGALDAFVEAFDHAPSAGVVFRAIERLAEATGRLEPLAHALLALAARARHVDGRVAFAVRAAELLETRIDDPTRAFAALRSAWEASNAREDEARARGLLGRFAARDAEAARRAGDGWLAALRARVDRAWDAGERAVWLARAALVEAEALRDPARAAALLDEAARADREADPDPESRIPYLCDRAEALHALPGGHEEAIECIESASSADLAHPRVRTLAARLGVVLPEIGTAAPAALDELSFAGLIDDLEPSTPPVSASAPAPEAPADPEVRPASTAPAWSVTLPTPTGLHEAAHRLRTQLRDDPARIDALRALHALARERGAQAETRVTAWLLSLFDPTMDAPEPVPLEGAIEPELLDVTQRDPAHAARLTIVQSVWEHGAQRTFRRSLQSLGTLGTDRVPPGAHTPLARAFDAASRTLARTNTPLYQRQSGGAELIVAATTPPAIIVGPAFDGPDAELQFRLGHALELARPGHLIIGALEPAETRVVLEATLTAFGPADASHGASREAAALAAEFWRVMPPVHQRAVREAVAALDAPLTEASLRTEILDAAARAGLLAAGDLRIAALALCAGDPGLAPHALETEAGYRAAVTGSPSLAALIGFALSDAFLVTLARAGA